MGGRRGYIENINVKMGKDGMVLFDSQSGGEPLFSCMSRPVAMQCAYDILHAVEEADIAELGGNVVPLR